MSDMKVKKEVKKIKTTKTSNKKISIKTNEKNKSKNNTKVITETTNKQINKKNRVCTIAIVTALSILFLFFLFNKTFFRSEYKIKNIAMDIPYFMIFAGDKDGVLTLKTWRNYENIKAYFDEYLENLENFDFYNCNDGRTLYFDEEKELAIYDIDIDRNFFIKTITINYEIVSSDRVCD